MRLDRQRRAIIAALAVLWLAVGSAFAQPQGTLTPGQITLAAYNILNLFDVFDDPYTEDEGTRVKPLAEVEKVAGAIAMLDADFLVITEVENHHVLEAMAHDWLAGKQYRYFDAPQPNGDRGIRVGIMSRLPLRSVTAYRWRKLTLPGESRTWEFARGPVHAVVEVSPTRVLHVIGVHLKSKYDSDGDPDSRKWRLAEATELRRIVEEIVAREPDAWLAVMGDFNDTPESQTLATIRGQGSALPLHDVHESLSAPARITYLRSPYQSAIDYILVTPSLQRALVKDSAKVLADPALLGGSDHAPVAASFRMSE